jgi:hypothetical protein
MMRFLIEGLIVRVRAFTQPVSTARRLQAENDRLQDICASAYQLAGLVAAPVRFLDALSNPCDATPEQIDALIPVGENEIGAVAESQALRTLLKEARNALDYFRRWGEGVNTAIGHYPPAGAWKPTLDAIARIDAALKLERWDYGGEQCK